jgi:hypothetical protein
MIFDIHISIFWKDLKTSKTWYSEILSSLRSYDMKTVFHPAHVETMSVVIRIFRHIQMPTWIPNSVF